MTDDETSLSRSAPFGNSAASSKIPLRRPTIALRR
jgi:hypothetical protein